ncbi:Acg family FMN-binding oxidoreductase [Krasilnikovia sp. M28-CT-15]|uniref:Acg family FMN-binding oxidoreductase n=1 Tax=Krasilnikovia sp. M28-CT-15 TaxID=3373540 RepID=UPI003875FD92
MPPARHTDLERALAEAARVAQRAPSVFNTQPWRWRVGPRSLELLRDPGRQLTPADPDGHQLLLSCGAALHHARLALAAAGRLVDVSRLPDEADPDLLARLDVHGHAEPDPWVRRLRGAIPTRHTDRRPFGPTRAEPATLARLEAAARAEDTGLYPVPDGRVPTLARAAAVAAAAELADPAYRAMAARWTGRPPGSDDGVAPGSAVRPGPHRVPVRDYTPAADAGRTPQTTTATPVTPGADAASGLPRVGDPAQAGILAAGSGDDRGTTYAILHGPGDGPRDWLRAGEALSAVLLTTVVEGLANSPMTDVLEVPEAAGLVRGLLPGGDVPYLVLRIGVAVESDAPPPTARRRPGSDRGFGG